MWEVVPKATSLFPTGCAVLIQDSSTAFNVLLFSQGFEATDAFFEERLWIVSCRIPNYWSFFRLQREAKVLGAGPDLTLGHLWPSHKQNPDPEWERIGVGIWVELFVKKKAKWLKTNPVPMPCSDDAGWIIHCELFIQRMRLAFMLNTLLASFDFLFHYSLCSVPLRNSNLFISESLFSESEKKNTWETTFSWCWSDTANTSLGKDSLAVKAFSWNSGKQCSFTPFSCRWTP